MITLYNGTTVVVIIEEHKYTAYVRPDGRTSSMPWVTGDTGETVAKMYEAIGYTRMVTAF